MLSSNRIIYYARCMMGFSIMLFLACSSTSSNSQETMESSTNRESAYKKYPDALYPIKVKDKWGYMNRKGEVILSPNWADAGDFKEGFAVVAISDKENLRYGMIDQQGKWIVEPQYEKMGHFSEDFALVSKNEQYGYIDRTGKEVIPCQFAGASHFSEGFVAVEQKGKVGFINSAGKMVIEPQFTCSVQHPFFHGGLAPVFGMDEKTGFIDTTGQWAIEPKFHSASNFKNDKAWAMTMEDAPGTQYGFTIRGGYIGRDGQYLIEPAYEFGWDFSEEYATVWIRSEDKTRKIWKVINEAGEVVLDELPYRNVGALKDGLIPIQDEEMNWGFMNIKGEVIIPPKYAGINHFSNGLARMEAGSAFSNKIVYINETGEVVWKE